MHYLLSPFREAHLNLSLEEILFEEIRKDILLIYTDEDAVVVGKHQNAIAEINARFLYENDIPVLRRFSGGGTVFHDAGNINFSFITTGADSRVIDFKKYALPVADFLRKLGTNAELTERNDIFVDGKKVSGHAAHARGTRALHHGTLLFDADLRKLSEGLKVKKGKFRSRAVQSVRSPVTNISEHIPVNMDRNAFVSALSDHLKACFDIREDMAVDEELKKKSSKLAEGKYRKDEWNYGYSPDYSFEVSIETKTGLLHFTAYIEKGLFHHFEFHHDHFLNSFIRDLTGLRHNFETVANYFNKLPAHSRFSGATGQATDYVLLTKFF